LPAFEREKPNGIGETMESDRAEMKRHAEEYVRVIVDYMDRDPKGLAVEMASMDVDQAERWNSVIELELDGVPHEKIVGMLLEKFFAKNDKPI
jgi:hypothetical protein